MRKSNYFLLLLIGSCLAIFNACTEPRDFREDIHAIDSLQNTLENAEKDIDSITSPVADTMTTRLLYIQENFKGFMQQSMARTLLRYGNFREKTNQLSNWKDTLHIRKTTIENEMSQLKQALAEMATHDANMHEITVAYADSVLHQIESAQEFWHTKINEWIQLNRSVNEEWQPLHDSIVFWTDSIQPAKRP